VLDRFIWYFRHPDPPAIQPGQVSPAEFQELRSWLVIKVALVARTLPVDAKTLSRVAVLEDVQRVLATPPGPGGALVPALGLCDVVESLRHLVEPGRPGRPTAPQGAETAVA
jgi:hypothetical protein